MYKSVLFCCLVVYVTAAPPTDVVPLEKQQPTVIPIVSQSEELEPNGTYKFSYETGNGIKREETSYSKIVPRAQGRSAGSNEGGESDESDEVYVQRGSYSYTAPDGTVISVRYIADENGFQPIGDHIPQAISIAASPNSAEKTGRALDIKDSADAASVPAAFARTAPSPVKPDDEKKPELENVKVGVPEVASAAADKSLELSNSEASTTVTSVPEAVEANTTVAAGESSTAASDDALTTAAVVSEAVKEAASEATTSAATIADSTENSTSAA